MEPADIRYGTFSSPASAQSQLRSWLKSPNKTAGVEKKLDKSGEVIGERVIVSFKDTDGKEVTKVILTVQSDYYEIGALSLSSALELEKWTRPPHPPLI